MVEHTCPQCNRYTHPQTNYCEYCGFEFVNNSELSDYTLDNTTISPEILVPRIGDYMIEQGVLDQEGLQRSLDYQKERSAGGKSILLGQAMLELGLVSRETLDQVITLQILKLQGTLRGMNMNLQRLVEERTQELQQALERLTELNNLKSNFISNISHELRTPLTHLKGYLDILAEGDFGSLNEKQLEAIDILKRSEERLEFLIDDLIQFSLASRGEMNISPHPIEIGQLVQTSIGRVSQKIKDKDIQLKVDVPSKLPEVKADNKKLAWVMNQLLDNAIKFTPHGGRIHIQAYANGGYVKVAITDTGIGIPADRVDEIFEPFHQLDGSNTRRYSGTGLGLTMVRHIIEAHGSSIEVESLENKGSRFQFSLPIVMSDKNKTPVPLRYE